MKELSLAVKLSIVTHNARRAGKAEAAIINEQIFQAEKELIQKRIALEEKFDLECWNNFVREFSPEEIESMAACERDRLNYENGEDEV